ncbi:hypothetical protein BGW37DRAFT_419652, partial [Umbelopsis sp. PMI_123]
FTAMKTAIHKFIVDDCGLSLKRTMVYSVFSNAEVTLDKQLAWAGHWSAADMDYMQICVFIDEASLNINLCRTVG